MLLQSFIMLPLVYEFRSLWFEFYDRVLWFGYWKVYDFVIEEFYWFVLILKEEALRDFAFYLFKEEVLWSYYWFVIKGIYDFVIELLLEEF